MEIKIIIDSKGRSLTLDDKSFKFFEGNVVLTNAEDIEKYSPCALLYFKPAVKFSNEYCSINKLIYLNDQFDTSFSWQACGTVLAYTSMPKPELYMDLELDDQYLDLELDYLDYQIALRKIINLDTKIEIRDFDTSDPTTIALNYFGIIIKGGSYKKIFSELNKTVGRLHNSTLRSLGWK